jgi:uncharacterized membrane protein YczE/cytidylate kinase
MDRKDFLKRSAIFVLGLFIVALGVAFSVKANLGVSPVSCIPYIYSLGFPLTMGTLSIVMNGLLIVMQIVLKRRKYQLVQLVQFPVALIFGFFTDFTLFLVSGIDVTNYFSQLALCLFSCAVIAFGVFLEVKAKVTYLAGEGLALVIADTFHVEFGKAKIGVDSTLVVIGIISSFLLLGSLHGVREGTIAAALLVGAISRYYSKRLKLVDKFLGNKPKEEITIQSPTQVEAPAPGMVITISREFGSGGHEIGKKVAEKLGFAFYDKSLIGLTAEKGGFTPEYIKEHEQKLAHSLLFNLYEQNYAYVDGQVPPLDALFLVQSKIIREVSEAGACVVVGRCANFVLKGRPNCFNVFVHANHGYRKKRLAEKRGMDEATAEKEIEKTDRERANYCMHYTGLAWGEADNYHLTIDSSLLGAEKSAELIIEAIEKYKAEASK